MLRTARCLFLPLASVLLLTACGSESADSGQPHKQPAVVGFSDNELLPSTAAENNIEQGANQALRQPEIASDSSRLQPASGWNYSQQAVAAANPLAAETGQALLAAGGNALDAAIAAQLVLNLVEPQSSGIGGGAFLLSWKDGELIAWDGRETAPAAATPNLLLDEQGQSLPFMAAVTSSRSVGVPGLLKMLEAAHKKQGQLPWQALFEPAIKLAKEGFAISPRLHLLLEKDPVLRNNPAARAYYYQPDGKALPVGHLLKNPAMAVILKRIASEGAEAFYQGTIAQSLVAAVNATEQLATNITTTDLTHYQPLAREALCGEWKIYRVCGFPPPSSGQLAIMQILGMLEQLEVKQSVALTQEKFYTAQGLHQYLAASNLAFADRALYLADPEFVEAPANNWLSLIHPAYLQERANEIGEGYLGFAKAGQPEKFESSYALQPEQPEYGTSHLSVIDAQGNGIAMTSSIEQAFGSRILVDGGTGLAGGFFLNNQLTDFAFQPQDAAGKWVANRVEAGKRPRSSMSPTLVFSAHANELVASLGSPGGAAIIHFTAKTLLASLGWQLSPQKAIELPNIANFNTPANLLEAGAFSSEIKTGLEKRGYQLQESDLTSGIQMLLVTPKGILGGADPRREGWVSGE